ncbi:amidohydrolase family protein [Salinibacterium soli]|uniref:Amidohydrolase family protein n=1 Tax=Antiquaquibacter soli TaxID=3064523 RepID=A0ABT9BL42_9MICO|nr:amidohydrolase family protein [Protaetiibacter sp. WY-16]MDO7881167.1 amidohydrolase family protein [Protaetiibacter sp. WY-16]
MDDERSIIPDAAIAIVDGAIVDLGPDADVVARWGATEVIDAAGAPVHPGLVEAHLHCSYQLFRGALPDQLQEEDAFREFEGHFYRAVDDEDEHASAVIAALEMIRHGTTAFLEPGTVLEVEAAATAAELVGIRAVLADSFIWDDPEGLAMGKNAHPERNTSMIPRAASDRASVRSRLGRMAVRQSPPGSLVTGHVAVLGLGTASTELMIEAKRVADDAGVVLNFHQSYSPGDTARDHQRLGAHPIVALRDLGVVDRSTTMAHVNHVSDAEFHALVESGATVAWAPAASMMWGHGSTLDGRHAELHRAGASVALGSDSPNWSNSLDLFRQASLAVLTARESHRDRTYLVAEDGFAMATRGGARAAGISDRAGSIEIGKRADLVVHSLRRPELLPLTDPVRNLVYSAGSSTVDTVVIEGRVVLRGGMFPHLDEEALLRRASERSVGLLRRMGYTVGPNDLGRRV